MSSKTSHACSSGKHVDAVLGGPLGASLGTGLHAVLTVNAKADQRTDLATKLDRLVLRKVAQMSNLDAAIRVLVHGQRIDHTHRIARPQPLQLGDDLTVEVRLAKTQDEQLYRAN